MFNNKYITKQTLVYPAVGLLFIVIAAGALFFSKRPTQTAQNLKQLTPPEFVANFTNASLIPYLSQIDSVKPSDVSALPKEWGMMVLGDAIDPKVYSVVFASKLKLKGFSIVYTSNETPDNIYNKLMDVSKPYFEIVRTQKIDTASGTEFDSPNSEGRVMIMKQQDNKTRVFILLSVLK